MTPEQRAALAKEFPEFVVRYLPEVWCETCEEGKYRCPEHPVEACARCEKAVSTAHIHSPYIPQIYIRDRLSGVDPEWTWRPMGHDPLGRPAVSGGTLWIYLFVGDVRAIGCGDVPNESGGRAQRQAITSAIKHAAETGFGVGQYLRLRDQERPPIQIPEELPERPEPDEDTTALRTKVFAVGKGARRMNRAAVEQDFIRWTTNDAHPQGTCIRDASPAVLAEYKALLEIGAS
jgi:hypothetical protein